MSRPRRIATGAGLLLTACVAQDPPPSTTPFSSALIARVDGTAPAARTQEAVTRAEARPPLPARSKEAERRGLIEVPIAEARDLIAISASDERLDDLLASPLSSDELALVAVLRSPGVRDARERYHAARSTYAQAADLDDLVALYRSYARDTDVRVGPDRSRRATAMIAPAPNVSGLSAEVATRTADIAFESLRAVVRDVVADAKETYADAVHLFEARAILGEEVELDAVLLDILLSRLEAGTGSQAGYLAFQARAERMRIELAILEARELVIRARWNRLLSRPESAPVALPTDFDLPDFTPAADRVFEQALQERQELRRQRLVVARSELAVRLAETMTLPRLDVGASRFERERAGEASIQRGAAFPPPGRSMPRAEFGVREAQVAELRARASAASAALESLVDQVRTETREALFTHDAAARRVAVFRDDVVPLARQSLDAARGSYEGNRASYLDLLDALQRLLDARLGLLDSRRDLVHAHARLLRATGTQL